MDNTNSQGITEEKAALIMAALEKFKILISKEEMIRFVLKRRKYPKIEGISLSMLGIFYVFSTIVHSKLAEKELFISESKFIFGIIAQQEIHWLEIANWYIYADGFTTIKFGETKELSYKLIESKDASEIYKNYFSEESALLYQTNKSS